MKTASILSAIILLIPSIILSQELSTLTKTEPLIIHGNTGASLSFNESNESIVKMPPTEWNLYGNYKMQVYGVELPFSFVIDQFSQNYSHPFTQFGITPSYKWAKFYLGYSNIQLSQLNASGHSFNGAGIELTPDKFRFSAFWGRLNIVGNDLTTTGPYDRSDYSGTGYGVKLGIGTTDNYIDVTYFHAKNDRSSADIYSSQKTPENEVIGTDFKVKILKVASITANFAVSRATKESQVESTVPILPDSSLSNMPDINSTANSGNAHPWALESAFSIDLKKFTAVISYKKVQPGFTMWGEPSTFTDGQIISLINGFSLVKGIINLTTNITRQSNDHYSEWAGELNLQAKKDNSTITGNFTIYRLYDKDPLTSPINQNKNLSASLTYNWIITEKSISLSLMSSYNHFVQSGISGSSLGAVLGLEADLLKDKKLNLNGSIGYVYSNSLPGDSRGNITLSCKAAYQLNKNCALGFFVNYILTPEDTRYNYTDEIGYKTTTHTLSAGISYTSSF